MTLEDLAAIDTMTLLRAIAERLSYIETGELEERCLLPRPTADISLYEKLQELLASVRCWVAADDVGAAANRLSAAIADLADVRLLPDPAESDSEASVGDIIALGQRHALLARRHAELQHLYKVRMDVTRDALQRARNTQAPLEPSSD